MKQKAGYKMAKNLDRLQKLINDNDDRLQTEFKKATAGDYYEPQALSETQETKAVIGTLQKMVYHEAKLSAQAKNLENAHKNGRLHIESFAITDINHIPDIKLDVNYTNGKSVPLIINGRGVKLDTADNRAHIVPNAKMKINYSHDVRANYIPQFYSQLSMDKLGKFCDEAKNTINKELDRSWTRYYNKNLTSKAIADKPYKEWKKQVSYVSPNEGVISEPYDFDVNFKDGTKRLNFEQLTAAIMEANDIYLIDAVSDGAYNENEKKYEADHRLLACDKNGNLLRKQIISNSEPAKTKEMPIIMYIKRGNNGHYDYLTTRDTYDMCKAAHIDTDAIAKAAVDPYIMKDKQAKEPLKLNINYNPEFDRLRDDAYHPDYEACGEIRNIKNIHPDIKPIKYDKVSFKHEDQQDADMSQYATVDNWKYRRNKEELVDKLTDKIVNAIKDPKNYHTVNKLASETLHDIDLNALLNVDKKPEASKESHTKQAQTKQNKKTENQQQAEQLSLDLDGLDNNSKQL